MDNTTITGGMQDAEKLNWGVKTTLERFENAPDGLSGDELKREGYQPAETIVVDGNLLLNEGIGRMLNLLIGVTTNPFNAANARIGVGTSNTAAVATQSDLVGATKFYKGMDAGYPSISGQTVTFKTTFSDAEANFSWQEWSIDNGSSAGENLNRKVVNLGTKASGQWSLTVSITVS